METCKYEHLRIGFKPWAPNANHATTIPPFIAEDSTSDIMKGGRFVPAHSCWRGQ